MTVTITQDQSTTITETIEDTVAYLCQDLYESGTPMSGQTIYKIIAAYAETKCAEFNGELA